MARKIAGTSPPSNPASNVAENFQKPFPLSRTSTSASSCVPPEPGAGRVLTRARVRVAVDVALTRCLGMVLVRVDLARPDHRAAGAREGELLLGSVGHRVDVGLRGSQLFVLDGHRLGLDLRLRLDLLRPSGESVGRAGCGP